MGIFVSVVDAFTDKQFGGNPAAVCVLKESVSDGWMQQVAAEMNLSETAFLLPQDDGFSLRWFTPTVEVDLCGHATLASAYVLWQEGFLNRQSLAKFYTRSGLLTAESVGDWIELNFPVTPAVPVGEISGLAEALGVAIEGVYQNQFDYLVEVNSEAIVRGIEPDFGLLKKMPVRGVIVTSLAESEGYDFVSRFFAPAAGINEDPVTGSAHCTLGPFWQERLQKSQFLAYQASSRGGVIRVRLQGHRVFLGGQAVTVWRGELV